MRFLTFLSIVLVSSQYVSSAPIAASLQIIKRTDDFNKMYPTKKRKCHKKKPYSAPQPTSYTGVSPMVDTKKAYPESLPATQAKYPAPATYPQQQTMPSTQSKIPAPAVYPVGKSTSPEVYPVGKVAPMVNSPNQVAPMVYIAPTPISSVQAAVMVQTTTSTPCATSTPTTTSTPCTSVVVTSTPCPSSTRKE